MKMGKAIGLMLLTVGIVFTLVGAYGLSEQSTAVAAYEGLAHVASASDDDEAKADAIDWDALLAANPDIVAWCRVEGTSISLPVCQASDEDPEFWLSHDLWGNDSPAGTLYIDHRCDADSRHVLCYGHHLTGTGGMFSELYHCHEQDVFDQVLTGDLLWSTPDGKTTKFHPLCASAVDKGDSAIQHLSFTGEFQFHQWLQTTLSRSTAHKPGAHRLANETVRAITLVTCSSDIEGQRGRTIVTFSSTADPSNDTISLRGSNVARNMDDATHTRGSTVLTHKQGPCSSRYATFLIAHISLAIPNARNRRANSL